MDDGFSILKVGPCLTFAVREAFYGLEMACRELDGQPLTLRDTMERLMLAEPEHWQGHIHGTPELQASQRHFGMSDRIRYYWPQPDAEQALAALVERVRTVKPHPGLLSQYVGADLVAEALMAGDDLHDLNALAQRAARRMVRPWYQACG